MAEALTTRISAADHAAAMADYVADGERRAYTLGNRGPIRYGSDGKLHSDILDAYWEHGFYVFEGLVAADEIAQLRAEIGEVLDRAPLGSKSSVDRHGRPAFGSDYKKSPFMFIKPLSDPWGGTELLNGRHPVQMSQPQAAADAPDEVVYLIGSMCRIMPSGLRLYGHADILSIAEAINGSDFVPFNDATFVKQPGVGGSVAWHQDGVTHWDADNWDEGIHGFNFQVQLYACTPRNCLWVMPGTHKEGRQDIKARIAANGGDEKLPGAVPLICNPGDVTIANRQVLHGSFANTSKDLRISLTFGFHRRRSVLGQRGALSQGKQVIYDEERVFQRSSVIALAIDARAQHAPEERRYVYAPFVGLEDDFRCNDATCERVLTNYTDNDLSI